MKIELTITITDAEKTTEEKLQDIVALEEAKKLAEKIKKFGMFDENGEWIQ